MPGYAPKEVSMSPDEAAIVDRLIVDEPADEGSRCDYWKLKLSQVPPSKKNVVEYVRKKGGGVCASANTHGPPKPKEVATAIVVPTDVAGDHYLIHFDVVMANQDEWNRKMRLGSRGAAENPSTLRVVGPSTLTGVQIQLGTPDHMATGSFTYGGPLVKGEQSFDVKGDNLYVVRVVRGAKRRDVAIPTPVSTGLRATIRIQEDFFDSAANTPDVRGDVPDPQGAPAVAKCDTASLKDCTDKCRAGSATSCYELGWMHTLGTHGASKDAKRAFHLFDLACKGGDGAGCVKLAEYYNMGMAGIPKNEAKACTIYRSGCQLGDASSCIAANSALCSEE